MYAMPFTKVLGQVGFQVTSKVLGIVPYGSNQKDYKHVHRGQSSRLQSDSYEKQYILYVTEKMNTNSIMGTIYVYKWTGIIVAIGLDNIVHHDREPLHDSILNYWIQDWDPEILRTRYQENDQNLLHKHKNLRFLDDKDNQTYMIGPEKLKFKRNTIRNEKYCVVGKTLNWRDGDNVDLLISIDINDNLMVLIKGF